MGRIFDENYLLRRNIEILNPQVNFFEDIHTWYDEKYARSTSSTREKSSKTENDGTLIFLESSHR